MANEIINEDYIDLLVENTAVDYFNKNNSVTPINDTHSIVHARADINNKCLMGEYPYHVFSSIFTLESDVAFEASGINKVRTNSDININLTGEGVLIGIVDTGIDYSHEAFINPDGSSKIVYIWDQTINYNSEPPDGFTYGTEFSKEDITNALKSSDPLFIVPSKDEIGHGTMIAGIVAGNENIAAGFSGVVPKAELVIVKMKQAKILNRRMYMIGPDKICYQETDIMLGVKYVKAVAAKLNRPISICVTIGSSQGGHDGLGALSSYLSRLTLVPGVQVVNSCGNEGAARRHVFDKISTIQRIKYFELNVSSRDKGFSMEIWEKAPSSYSIDITTPGGQYYQPIPPSLNGCRVFTPSSGSVIWVNNFLVETETGDQVIIIRFQNPEGGIWKFGLHNIESTQSEFHVWLPSGDLISDNTYLLNSSPDTTVTSPGNGIDTMTITAYNPSDETIYPKASRGYSRINLVTPTLAAPGVNIRCPLVNNLYGYTTGTGAATAIAAGIVAMVFEWAIVKGNFPTISGFDVKKLLIRGAERSPNMEYPNKIWGYGKIDAYSIYENLI
jgi:hypothetical protein